MTVATTDLQHAPHPAAVAFLEGLYGSFERGWLTLFTLRRDDAHKSTDWRPVLDTTDLAAVAAGYPDRCVWFGIATRRRRLTNGLRGGAEDCEALPGLWVDIDVTGPNHAATDLPPDMGAALELVEAFPVSPTAIVDTGGGLQAHWLFAEPLPIDADTRGLLARWGTTWASMSAGRGWHLDNVFTLAQVMRLPGTTNTKGGQATPVELLAADWSLRYGTDDLDQWLQDPPPAPEARPVDRVPYIGPERPGDAYNARHSVEEVLVELGFTPHHRRLGNGDLHFKAPGADGDTGATAYADGHATIWSETYARDHPGVRLRQPYGPFGIMGAVRHAGNYAAAAADLRVKGYGAPPQRLEDLIAPGATTNGDGTRAEPEPEVDVSLVGIMRARQLSTSAFLTLPAPTWLVDKLIPAGSLTTLYGPPGSGKSFVAIDIACAVALGHDWHGAAVRGGRVLYVILEGASGATRRVAAWCDHHDVDPADVDITWDRGPVSLFAGLDHVALAALVEEGGYVLVVVDTLARAALGAEENSAKDMGIIVAAATRLTAAGATVLVVHHTGKDTDRGARGSNALKGAVDAELEVTGRNGHLTVSTRKQKDAAEARPIRMRLAAHGDSAVLALVETEGGASGFRPTTLMGRVSERLEAAVDGMTRTNVRQAITGRNEAIDRALDVLVEEGWATLETSPTRSTYRHLRRYRSADDPGSDDFSTTLTDLVDDS